MRFDTKRVARDVERILAYNKLSRGSDRELLIQCWGLWGLKLNDEQKEMFKRMPSAETVTRVRRKLQEGGKYLPDEKIAQERHDKQEQMKQEMMNW